jgi:7,8-dihydropterin-6-yl-methyl-4-(beta-D-ribofuranosyl)aminobenzene 5'-phosphate synthase
VFCSDCRNHCLDRWTLVGSKELTGEGLCSAHHGLSLVVTARLGAQERSVLFDAGPDPYALERNVRRMGLAFEKIEAVVLCHGHFDHSEGLLKAIELIRGSKRRHSIPLHLHPGVFVHRAVRLPNGRHHSAPGSSLSPPSAGRVIRWSNRTDRRKF